jgi:NSS family neurotransmitter:Na+ symporter
MGWQLIFLVTVAFISGRGLGRGIEVVSRIRAPALLALLLLLDAYALYTGDVPAALHFAFAPHWEALSAGVVLAAIGQAFFATGVGLGMMLAYGSYMSRHAPLVRPALAICGSILLASLLATLMVFPLVFRFHMDPAGGPALVFDVLPTVFAVMPGGRLVGTVFFLLLILAALTPTLAAFEPVVAWLGSGRAVGLVRGQPQYRLWPCGRRAWVRFCRSTCSHSGTHSMRYRCSPARRCSKRSTSSPVMC